MVDAVQGKYDQFFADATDPVQVQTWEEMQHDILQAVEHEKGLLVILFGIISVVAIFLIFCIFFMIVMEKTRDIGIIKSVGATSGHVAGIFLGYGLTIGVLGGGMGLLLAYLVVHNINQLHADLGYYFDVEIWSAQDLSVQHHSEHHERSGRGGDRHRGGIVFRAGSAGAGHSGGANEPRGDPSLGINTPMSNATAQPLSAARNTSEAVLVASGVRRVFRMGDSEIQVLKSVDLAVKAGEFIAIEGRSGSGKSTLSAHPRRPGPLRFRQRDIRWPRHRQTFLRPAQCRSQHAVRFRLSVLSSAAGTKCFGKHLAGRHDPEFSLRIPRQKSELKAAPRNCLRK